jgi:hypothetical protein
MHASFFYLKFMSLNYWIKIFMVARVFLTSIFTGCMVVRYNLNSDSQNGNYLMSKRHVKLILDKVFSQF